MTDASTPAGNQFIYKKHPERNISFNLRTNSHCFRKSPEDTTLTLTNVRKVIFVQVVYEL